MRGQRGHLALATRSDCAIWRDAASSASHASHASRLTQQAEPRSVTSRGTHRLEDLNLVRSPVVAIGNVVRAGREECEARHVRREGFRGRRCEWKRAGDAECLELV